MSDFRSNEIDDLVPITPTDDGSGQGGPYAAFYVGNITGGTSVKVRTLRGHDVTIPGVVAGRAYPFAIKWIWSTGTTAGGFLGCKAVSDVT